jgi:hypothetical protein
MKDDVVLVEVSPEGVAQQSVAGKHGCSNGNIFLIPIFSWKINN